MRKKTIFPNISMKKEHPRMENALFSDVILETCRANLSDNSETSVSLNSRS